MIDVSDIAQPRLVGEACAPGDPLALAASGDHVFVVGEAAGFMVFSSQCAAATGVPSSVPPPPGIRCSPNPSARGTVIDFATTGSGVPRVEVFDVTGRLVRTVASAGAGAGRHEMAWDGADGAGRPVPPGIYFVRVTDGMRTRSTRMVISR